MPPVSDAAALTAREAEHLLGRLAEAPGTLSEADVRGVAAALNDRRTALERRETAVVMREERAEAECARLVQEAAETSDVAAGKLAAAEAKMSGAEKFLSQLEQDRAAFDAVRAAADRAVADRRAALDAAHAARGRQLDVEAETERAAWRERADAAEEKLAADRTAVDRLRDRLDEEWRELEADRDRLTAERERFDTDQIAARELLEQERAVIENRLDFREQHLARTAEELRQARAEWDGRVQTVRTALAASAAQASRRRGQLDRYRDLLDRRERELAAAAAAAAAEHAETGTAVKRRRSEVEADFAAAAAESEDQAQRLTADRETLEARGEQIKRREKSLDELRAQLEDAHRETLALRVAVEELLPQLRDAGPAAPVGLRLEESRRRVVAYLGEREEAVNRRVVELEFAKAALARQAEDLETQRRLLTSWEAERRVAAADREAEVLRRAAAVAARDELLDAARHRRRAETEETAAILRGLLREMEETVAADIAAAPQVFKLPEPAVRGVVDADGLRRAA